jgi:hypothetical protein
MKSTTSLVVIGALWALLGVPSVADAIEVDSELEHCIAVILQPPISGGTTVSATGQVGCPGASSASGTVTIAYFRLDVADWIGIGSNSRSVSCSRDVICATPPITATASLCQPWSSGLFKAVVTGSGGAYAESAPVLLPFC